MIVEKRKSQMQKRVRRQLLVVHDVCVLKEEGKKVILKFERVVPSHTSQIG
jgi:hypothetical protein